jgi:membrane protein DedA with SNARE-associated domain
MGFLDGDTVQHLITHYDYAAIFLVVMMESTGIPMPGETILISAAGRPARHAHLQQCSGIATL